MKLKYVLVAFVALAVTALAVKLTGFHMDISVLGQYLYDGSFGNCQKLNLAVGVAVATKQNLKIRKADLKEIKLDKEMYKHANEENLSFSEYVEKKELEAGFDPKESDAGKLSPIERQFLSAGIDINSGRVMLEDFFRTPNSKILVPAYISDQIQLGMNYDAGELRVEDLYATKEIVTGANIDQIALDFTKENAKMKKSVEGSRLTKSTIKTKEGSVKLQKFGTDIEISYEAQRRVRVNILSILLQRIGYNMSQDMAQLGLKVAIEGDGNTGSEAPASTTVTTTPKYSDLLDILIKQKPKGHKWTHFVLSKQTLLDMLADETNFKALQSLNLQEEFVKTGEIRNFFNILWRTHDAMTNWDWFTYEKDSMMVYYEEKNSSIIEVDKVINQQFNETAISVYAGFGKLFDQACHLKSKHA
ncbi:MAG: phage capsid protein [Leptospiraceae bacterium]|nr:phage capsid protein [Leptospiraceae bacterium]